MMDRLKAVFTGALPPEVYRFMSRASAKTVERVAEERGWQCFPLDGWRIASKGDFLQVIAEEMIFPSYFGNNWDALVDCLMDLSWVRAEGYVVLFDHAGRFALGQPEEWVIAVDILRSAVEYWRPTPTPMVVLLRGAGRAASGLPQL